MDRDSLLEALSGFAERVTSSSLGEGDDPLVPFAWDGGDRPSLAELLMMPAPTERPAILQEVDLENYRALATHGANNSLRAESGHTDEVRQTLAELGRHAPEVKLLRFSQTLGIHEGADEWDVLYLVVARVEAGSWLVLGPGLAGEPQGRGCYGTPLSLPDRSIHVPEWLEPMRSQDLACVFQGDYGSIFYGEVPATDQHVVVDGATREAAIDEYFLRATFLKRYAFQGLQVGHHDPSIFPVLQELSDFLASHLQDARLDVLGHNTAYAHILVGRCADGRWAGFWTTAGLA